MINELRSVFIDKRLNCSEILKSHDLWSLCYDDVSDDLTVKAIVSNTNQTLTKKDNFILHLIKAKSKESAINNEYIEMVVNCDKSSNIQVSDKKNIMSANCDKILYISENKYAINCMENGSISLERYKKTYNATCFSDELQYAIRKQSVDYEKIGSCVKEIEVLRKLDKFIVPFLDFWFEENYYVKQNYQDVNTNFNYGSFYLPNFSHLLHIKLPLYSLSLRNVIEELKANYFDTYSKILTPCGYFVASQLFIEIVDAVNYLHRQRPAILHRNLKPENVMLSIDKTSADNFVRLTDIGLTSLDSVCFQTYSNYNSPEVNNFRKFSDESDAYALGVIAYQLFSINFESSQTYHDGIVQSKQYHLVEAINQLMSAYVDKRQSCATVLKHSNQWALYYDDVRQNSTVKAIVAKSKPKVTIEANFIDQFIRAKSKQKSPKWRKPIDNKTLIKKEEELKQNNKLIPPHSHSYYSKPSRSLSMANKKPIFISYVRKDASTHARSLKACLTEYGCEAFLDVDEIKVGNNWQGDLNNGVLSCNLFVPLVTPTHGTTKLIKREFANQLRVDLVEFGYIVWISCDDHNLNNSANLTSREQSFSSSDSLDQMSQTGVFLNQQNYNKYQSMTSQDSNISANEHKYALKFRSNLKKASVVVLILSEDYCKSNECKQQAFFCNQRVHVIAIKCDNFPIPSDLTKVYEEENILERGDENNELLVIKLKETVDKLGSLTLPKCNFNKINRFDDRMYYLAQQFKKHVSIFDENSTIIYIASSSGKSLSDRMETILKAIGKQFASIPDFKLISGNCIGGEDIIVKSFILQTGNDSNVYHILPVGLNAENGQTINIGLSIKERDSVVSQLVRFYLLIDNGYEAIRIAEEFCWNHKFFIPVNDDYEAATLPPMIMEMPAGMEAEHWITLIEIDVEKQKVYQFLFCPGIPYK